MAPHFRFDDGGRSAAGYKGKTGDCVARSIAIATGLPYQQIYDLVNGAAVYERTGTRKRGKSNARTGVYNELPSGRLVLSVSKHLTVVIDGVRRVSLRGRL